MSSAIFDSDPQVNPLPDDRWQWSFAGRWRNGEGKWIRGRILSGPTFASKVDAREDLREQLGNASLAVRCTCVDCQRRELERRLRRELQKKGAA